MTTQFHGLLRGQFQALRRQPDIAFWAIATTAALGLFSGIGGFLALAKAAHWLVAHWRNMTGWFWDSVFGWLHLDLSLIAKAQLALVISLFLLSLRVAYSSKYISPEEIERQGSSRGWIQDMFVITALIVYFLQLIPLNMISGALSENTSAKIISGKDDYIASILCSGFFVAWGLARLYQGWREWRGRPLETTRYRIGLRKALARLGSGVLLLVVLNFTAIFLEQLSGLAGELGAAIDNL